MYVGNIVEIPLGSAGLNGSKNYSLVAPNFLLDALNISFEEGTITKEGGAAKYNASALSGTPSIIGGWDWWPDTSTQRIVIVTSAGTILKDSGTKTFPTTLASGITVSNGMATFCAGGKEVAANNRKLFIFTGQNAVQVLSADAATTGSLATPPADWSAANQPIAGAIHEGRLWALGNLNDPHRVYYSTTGDHEDFVGAGSGSISVFPGEGEKLVGIISFKGYLIVWKFPTGVYLIDTSDSTVANWRVIRLSQMVGMPGPLCFTAVDNDVVYLDRDGNFQLLSATDEFGDLRSRNLSAIAQMSEFVRSNINLGQLTKTRGIYYPAKREAHFAMAGSNATTNTVRLIIDFNNPEVPRFRFSNKDISQSLWLTKDATAIQRPMSGDASGFVWNLDQSTKLKDSVGYLSQFKTAHDDLGRVDSSIANKRKMGDFIELVFQPRSAGTFFIDIIWDDRSIFTVPINTSGSGAIFDTSRWGESNFASQSEIKSVRKRIIGSGRRVSFNCRGIQDFSIGRLFLHYRVGDERI